MGIRIRTKKTGFGSAWKWKAASESRFEKLNPSEKPGAVEAHIGAVEAGNKEDGSYNLLQELGATADTKEIIFNFQNTKVP